MDIWGAARVPGRVAVQDGSEDYKKVLSSPLASATIVKEIEECPHWPSPDGFGYGGIAAQCEALRGQGRAVVFIGDRLNRVAQLKPGM
ncbi:MAG: hypothetical protein JXA74_16900 [Anaerolineae bacterium]|nr:hypothetical protein [Anaerolineae bacterium]